MQPQVPTVAAYPLARSVEKGCFRVDAKRFRTKLFCRREQPEGKYMEEWSSPLCDVFVFTVLRVLNFSFLCCVIYIEMIKCNDN